MPRDSQLLTPTSRALLRAARAGCIYIRQAPKETGEEPKEVSTDGEDQQTLHMTDRNFTARKWTAVPRHLEPPEVEFLAKRRPGLPSLYSAAIMGAEGSNENGAAPMRKTRFKKVDPATGNISVYEAWVPDGLRIEGETTEDADMIASSNSDVIVTPEAPAPGTVVEGVGAVNAEGVVVAEAGAAAVMTPPRRRPPPPKRKGKGIGRGRGRKKVMFAPGEGADASTVHGAEAVPADGTPGTDAKEGADASRLSVDQSGQDEEDEEEGEEGEESDDGEESIRDTKTPETPLQATVAAGELTTDTPMEDITPHASKSATTPDASLQAPSQAPQHPEISSQVAPNVPPDTENQVDEAAVAEDVNMTDYHASESRAPEVKTEPQPAQVTDTPAIEGAATAPESVPQPPEETPKEPESTSAQAAQVGEDVSTSEIKAAPQETEQPNPTNDTSPPQQDPVQEEIRTQTSQQDTPVPAGRAADTDAAIEDGRPAPQSTTNSEQPSGEIEEKPRDAVEGITEQDTKEPEPQTDAHIAPSASAEHTSEHAEEQPAHPDPKPEPVDESKPEQSKEKTQPEQQQQQTPLDQLADQPDQPQTQTQHEPNESTQPHPEPSTAPDEVPAFPQRPAVEPLSPPPPEAIEDKPQPNESPEPERPAEQDEKEEGEAGKEQTS